MPVINPDWLRLIPGYGTLVLTITRLDVLGIGSGYGANLARRTRGGLAYAELASDHGPPVLVFEAARQHRRTRAAASPRIY
jgi:hypothetical protein